MSDKKSKAAAAALVSIGLLSGVSNTASALDTTTMTINANVPGACRIENANTLDFGVVDNALGNPTDSSATVSWRCTRNTSATVEIDDGQSGSGRRMTGSASTSLPYELYWDSGRNNRWGGNGEEVSVTGNGMNNPETLTVYGRIESDDAQAADPATDYSDSVTISIIW
jgi:spore coat protein U-like protein